MATPLPPFGPGYDPAEALQILRLAAAVSTFVPRYNPDGAFASLDPRASATASPIVSTMPAGGIPKGTTLLPSLFPHRWPAGWVAGVWSGTSPTWEQSLVLSYGEGDHSFANQAMLSYNPEADAYCLAFRGTMTAGNALEDLGVLLVPAGPVTGADFIPPVPPADDKIIKFRIPAYARNFAEKIKFSNRWYCPKDIPGVSERAHVHGGFRVALESLDFAAVHPIAPANTLEKVINVLEHNANTLTGMLTEIGRRAMGRPIKLYVTGHSLGAGMASLCAGWLQTQPIPGATFQVKLYAFAQPKPGNDYFASAQGLAFGPGWIYAVINTLDTIPQVGLTLQNLLALNYQGCIDFLADKLGPVNFLAQNIPPFNFVHMGTEIYLRGESVAAGATPPQDDFYALPYVPATAAQAPASPEANLAKGVGIHIPDWMPGHHKPKPAPVKHEYLFPAYLFLPAVSGMSDNYTPPPVSWTVTPYAENVPADTLSMFAPLWQHMPWIYEQALVKQLPQPKA